MSSIILGHNITHFILSLLSIAPSLHLSLFLFTRPSFLSFFLASFVFSFKYQCTWGTRSQTHLSISLSFRNLLPSFQKTREEEKKLLRALKICMCFEFLILYFINIFDFVILFYFFFCCIFVVLSQYVHCSAATGAASAVAFPSSIQIQKISFGVLCEFEFFFLSVFHS